VPLESLSLQLYSVRDAMTTDIPGTLARVAEIGFTQVEASYTTLSSKPELLRSIRANNLTSPTMTSPLCDVDRDAVFATARELGAKTVIETFIPEPRWSTPHDVAHIADELNAAAETAAGYGLCVAYHNHWWELEHRHGGTTALEYLAARLHPEVLLEIDAYWVAVGGENVIELIGRLSDRVHFLHLKDGPINRDNSQQLPAGRGSMPLRDIIDSTPNLRVGVIEFDDYAGDVFEAIAESLCFLTPLVSAR